jgi:hypothetical protein
VAIPMGTVITNPVNPIPIASIGPENVPEPANGRVHHGDSARSLIVRHAWR